MAGRETHQAPGRESAPLKGFEFVKRVSTPHLIEALQLDRATLPICLNAVGATMLDVLLALGMLLLVLL